MFIPIFISILILIFILIFILICKNATADVHQSLTSSVNAAAHRCSNRFRSTSEPLRSKLENVIFLFNNSNVRMHVCIQFINKPPAHSLPANSKLLNLFESATWRALSLSLSLTKRLHQCLFTTDRESVKTLNLRVKAFGRSSDLEAIYIWNSTQTHLKPKPNRQSAIETEPK